MNNHLADDSTSRCKVDRAVARCQEIPPKPLRFPSSDGALDPPCEATRPPLVPATPLLPPAGDTPAATRHPSHVTRHFLHQIASPMSPSRTDVFSCGRSPLFHRAAVCTVRYLSGPPSSFSLRVIGRGMQTNSVRITSADKRTFA